MSDGNIGGDNGLASGGGSSEREDHTPAGAMVGGAAGGAAGGASNERAERVELEDEAQWQLGEEVDDDDEFGGPISKRQRPKTSSPTGPICD